MKYQLRKAKVEDIKRLRILIDNSIRTLGSEDYSHEQIDHALKEAFGVDTQLIRDGTYYVVEHDNNIIACGGWSRRQTLFGNDECEDRDSTKLNPESDAAKIRAFFVAPDYVRQGIATTILNQCESEAKQYGFSKIELMATIPGSRLYGKYGYIPQESIQHNLTADLTIEFIPMHKIIEN